MDLNEILGLNIESISKDNIPKNAIKIPVDAFLEFNIAGAAIKEFKDVNQFKGLVKMSFDKGAGVSQRARSGGYTGNIINDKGKIVGHVNLDDVSQATAVASSAMAVMSIVTSQYYMHEINKTLDYIQIKLDSIGKLIEVDKRNHIASREHYIHDLQKNLVDIQYNASENQAVLTQLQNLEIEAYSDYLTISELIESYIDSIDNVKKQDDILDLINKIKDYLPQLWCALYLYAATKYMRMILSGSVDKQRIDALYDELTEMTSKYEKSIEEYYIKAYDILKDHDAFTVNKVLFGVAKTLGDPLGIPGIVIRNMAIDGIKGKSQEKKDENKQEAVVNLFDTFYYTCKDTEPIRKICDDIKFYNTLYNEPVDIILDDNNDLYIVHGDPK